MGLLGPLGLSVALHGVLGVAAVAWFRPSSPLDLGDRPLELVEPLNREKLGIDRSDAVTITWLGFSTPTEHDAEPSEVEQSHLEIAETQEVMPNAPSVASVVVETPADEPHPEPAEQSAETLVQQADLVRESIENAVIETAESFRPLLDGLLALASRSTPTESAPPATTDSPESADANAASGGANREADATTTETIDARPGQVVAAQGLEIITVRPKFLTITRMTVWPHNPEVAIEFGFGGRVTAARFQPGRKTGHAEVDQALLDAIYQWRARGPRIDALTQTSQPMTINMRILMR